MQENFPCLSVHSHIKSLFISPPLQLSCFPYAGQSVTLPGACSPPLSFPSKWKCKVQSERRRRQGREKEIECCAFGWPWPHQPASQPRFQPAKKPRSHPAQKPASQEASQPRSHPAKSLHLCGVATGGTGSTTNDVNYRHGHSSSSNGQLLPPT